MPRAGSFMLVKLGLLIAMVAANSLLIGTTTGAAAPATAPGKSAKTIHKSTVEVGRLPPSRPERHFKKPPNSAGSDVISRVSAPGPSIPAGVTSGRMSTSKSSASSTGGTTSPLSPSVETPLPATLTGTHNGAIEDLDQFDATFSDGPTPPDNGFAVGPSDVVVFVNSTGQVLTRSPDHTQRKTYNLSTFFGAPLHPDQITQPAYSDPRVLYDTQSGRWFASILIFDSCQNADGSNCATTNNSEIDIATSLTGDPTGSWNVQVVETTSDTTLLDQPKLGVSNDKVVMTYNRNGFSGPYTFVTIQKSALIAGGSANDVFFGDSNHYNVIPVISLTSTNTEYAASANRGSSTLTIWQFTGTPDGGDATFSTHDFSIGTVNDPPQADQEGDSRQLDTGTAGVQSAVWQNGTLWAAGNDTCTPPGDSTSRPCIRFDRVRTSDMTLQQDADLGQNGADLFYPAVMPDSAGNLYAGHSVSSAAQFGTAGMTYFSGGSVASTNPGIDYKDGVGSYDCTFCFDNSKPPKPTRNRWGDYSGAAQDPVNPKDVWVHQEYGSASTTNTDDWATEVARLTTFPPAVSGIAPSHGPELSSCSPSVTINGTDFFSGATVSFGGVASSNVSVLSTDQLTAVAPSHVRGDVDVTVTTPAGTSATSPADVFTYDPDLVPPTTTASYSGANVNGWNKADFTVSFNAIDNSCGSGVQNITVSSTGAVTTSAFTTVGASASLSIGSEGITTISYFATDNAGNVESTKTLTVRLDKSAPVISISVPTATTYIINQNVASSYSCTDAVSGVTTCVGTVPNGSNIDTSSVGTRTFTVSATDKAGNASSASVTYTVSYKICLLYDPTTPQFANNLPIKLEICDANNVNLSSSSIVLTAVSVTPSGSIVSNANPGNLFRFDSKVAPGGGYVYNLSEKSSPAGSYNLNFVVAGDPNVHQAPFTLK